MSLLDDRFGMIGLVLLQKSEAAPRHGGAGVHDQPRTSQLLTYDWQSAGLFPTSWAMIMRARARPRSILQIPRALPRAQPPSGRNRPLGPARARR